MHIILSKQIMNKKMTRLNCIEELLSQVDALRLKCVPVLHVAKLNFRHVIIFLTSHLLVTLSNSNYCD